MSDEVVCLVDESNNVLGPVSRQVMRKQNLFHRSSFIFVINEYGKYLVQKRTSCKDYCPDYYDIATGGVVQFGESVLEVRLEHPSFLLHVDNFWS